MAMIGDDYSSNLLDECLALVFQSLSSGDRKRSSLVCHRWLRVEGESRHRISLDAKAGLTDAVPHLFSRFDSITKLALKCDRRSVSIRDDALIQISLNCKTLTRLKLSACREITDHGMRVFSENCRSLQKFSSRSCSFGAKGMNALLENCRLLEDLTVKRLRGIADETVGAGRAAVSLRVVCLKDLHNGLCFGPMIIGAKNLKSLKLFRCSGDWDKVFDEITQRSNALVEVHLEKLKVSDLTLSALSSSHSLEILHLVKTPQCTNLGLASIAKRCKLLRKLYIDGWRKNRISDQGLIAIAKHCPNLQDLVLISVNPTHLSLAKLGANCPNLQRLSLCGSKTVGDTELSCIAEKCVGLRKLCIKSCQISDHGIEALAGGCPNLTKVKVKNCKGVTAQGANWLRSSRDCIAVELELPEGGDVLLRQNMDGSNRRWSSLKMKVGECFRGRKFRRWLSRRRVEIKKVFGM